MVAAAAMAMTAKTPILLQGLPACSAFKLPYSLGHSLSLTGAISSFLAVTREGEFLVEAAPSETADRSFSGSWLLFILSFR